MKLLVRKRNMECTIRSAYTNTNRWWEYQKVL